MDLTHVIPAKIEGDSNMAFAHNTAVYQVETSVLVLQAAGYVLVHKSAIAPRRECESCVLFGQAEYNREHDSKDMER